MIEIKPYMHLDEEIIKKINLKNIDTHNFFMIAKDKEEIIGVGVMKIYDGYAKICDIWVLDKNFKMLAHGIGKSMLNFIERRNIYDTVCENEKLSSLMIMLRFKKEKSIEIKGYLPKKEFFYVNLKGYFDEKCTK